LKSEKTLKNVKKTRNTSAKTNRSAFGFLRNYTIGSLNILTVPVMAQVMHACSYWDARHKIRLEVKSSMELLIFLFKSGLPLEEISATSEKRADRYRKVKGLIQKYYVQDKS